MKKILLLIFTLLFFQCSQSGTWDALQDIRNNSPQFIIYGELMPFEKELGKKLYQEHGIKLTREHGCVVSKTYEEYVDSYNHIITKHYNLNIDSILQNYTIEISILQTSKPDNQNHIKRELESNQVDTLKCNTEILLKVYQNKDSLDEETLHQFFLTFGEECINNAEYSEWSNELLFDILQLYPAQIIIFLKTMKKFKVSSFLKNCSIQSMI